MAITTTMKKTLVGLNEWRKIVYRDYLKDFYTEELADGMTLREALRCDYLAAGGIKKMIDDGLFEFYYDDVRNTLSNIYDKRLIENWSDEKIWSFYMDELGEAIAQILIEDK